VKVIKKFDEEERERREEELRYRNYELKLRFVQLQIKIIEYIKYVNKRNRML
jgi:hypothetical protein